MKNNIKIFPVVLHMLAAAIAMVIPSLFGFAQKSTLQYEFRHAGKSIGTMTVCRENSGDTCRLHLQTAVNISMLISYFTRSREEAMLVNGVLVSSSFYRNRNGKISQNGMHRLFEQYTSSVNGNDQVLGVAPIRQVSLGLYHEEPLREPLIWSDNYQDFLRAEPVNGNTYKIQFPDGDCSFYHYEKGICTRVEISNPFYPVEMVLTNIKN